MEWARYLDMPPSLQIQHICYNITNSDPRKMLEPPMGA